MRLCDHNKRIFFVSTQSEAMGSIEVKIIDKLPYANRDEMKYIGKMMKDPAVKKQFPQFYDALRGQEITLTKKILGQAKSNPNVAESLKSLCLKGMHAEDILFGTSEQLDEFKTLMIAALAINRIASDFDVMAISRKYGRSFSFETYDDTEEVGIKLNYNF